MKYKRFTRRFRNLAGQDDIELFTTCRVGIERLAELEDKIENGTLIELPCKVGDTVYRIGKAINVEKQRYELYLQDYTIIKIKIYEEEILWFDDSDNQIEIADFGENVFKTKELAEQRLKELNSKQ